MEMWLKNSSWNNYLVTKNFTNFAKNIYKSKNICYNNTWKKEKGEVQNMKRLETVEAVHTHTHTHTDILLNKIVRNDKSFCVPQKRRNLKENCKI